MPSTTPKANKENLHVTITLGPGSVEHFHHFLLGFFVPLICELSTEWTNLDRVFVRGCGPMDRLLHEFGDDRIEIIDKYWHQQIRERVTRDGSPTVSTLGVDRTLRFVTLRGCDYPAAYNARKFAKARAVLSSLDIIQSEIRTTAANWPRGNARILLIERGAALDFYQSERSENKGSGRERRSIANHQELYQVLRQEHKGCLNVMTETLTLARQFALFSLADIIIAQHGAALANIVWARPSATVIEVFPKDLRADQRGQQFLLQSCSLHGISLQRFLQDREHADVDIELMRATLQKCITSVDYPVMSRLRAVTFWTIRPLLPLKIIYRSLLRRAWNKFARGIGI